MRPCSDIRARVFSATLLGVLCATALEGQQGGPVGGRVRDAGTLDPVVGAVVTLQGIPPVLTDGRGTFILGSIEAGAHRMTVEHLAYGTHVQYVIVEPGEELAIDVTISAQAIELAPLVVETTTELERRRVSSGHSINEVVEEQIDKAARDGLSLAQFIQGSMPGVRVRAGPGGRMCVTYRSAPSLLNLGQCQGVSIMLDGVPVGDAGYVLTSVPLRDIARLEVLSPGQAGVEYGTRAGQGVLLVETKRGREVRRSNLSRLRTGFDWSQEAEPYPWLKVFGSAFVANAVAVGVGLALADHCFWTPESAAFALRTRCPGLGTVAVSTLSLSMPALAGSVAARWGGRTDLSSGRLLPSVMTTGILLTGGYLMVIGNEGTSRTLGALVVGVGVPVTMTFADRIFRILR